MKLDIQPGKKFLTRCGDTATIRERNTAGHLDGLPWYAWIQYRTPSRLHDGEFMTYTEDGYVWDNSIKHPSDLMHEI